MRTPCELIGHWFHDETGSVAASNYLLLATILAIGIVAGLTAVRDSVVQELGDLGLALEHVDQSYTVSATIGTVETNFGYEDNPAADDPEGAAPAGIELNQPATPE